jgi:hypothetical protein
VTASSRTEGVETVLRQMDDTLEQWLKWASREGRHAQTAVEKTAHEAFVRGAAALRRQVDDLQVGLKKLSAGLEQVEHTPETHAPSRRAPSKRVRKARPASTKKAGATTRKSPAVTRKPRARKLKKAA